jgi:hypothetical protein
MRSGSYIPHLSRRVKFEQTAETALAEADEFASSATRTGGVEGFSIIAHGSIRRRAGFGEGGKKPRS